MKIKELLIVAFILFSAFIRLQGQTYTVTTSSSPSAGGTTNGAGSYDYGTIATVTATPATGYLFENWTEGGNVVSTNVSYAFTVTGNRTIVANFSLITYSISTSSSPSAGGTTSGGGTYSPGASATVTATPASGYQFLNWTEGGIAVSTNPSYHFPGLCEQDTRCYVSIYKFYNN